MSLIRWLRNVPIELLTAINTVLMLAGWLLEINGIAPTTPEGQQRYPSALQLVGLTLFSALPYLIVKKEHSGHGFAYSFAYGILVVFLWLDLDAVIRWTLGSH